ncbi:MAG: hypothetical protein ACJA1A_003324 [Saprospiraceae bacterium]|jgi:hypothetical protein
MIYELEAPKWKIIELLACPTSNYLSPKKKERQSKTGAPSVAQKT